MARRGNALELYSSQEIAPRRKKTGRKLGALALVSVVSVGGWAYNDDPASAGDNCTRVNQQLVEVGTQGFKNQVRGALDFAGLVNDERTITGVAEALSEERGWKVTPERLAAANEKKKFIIRDSSGVLQDSLPDGKHCFAVPSPIYGGLDVVEEDGETLAEIVEEQDADITYLRKLNPHLARKKDTDELPIGTTVRVDDEIDTSFVYRPMKESEKNINGMGDIKMRYKILMANVALMGSGETPVKPGDEGYFPLVGGESDGKKFTEAQILEAYPANFAPVNVDNTQINKKTPKKANTAKT